MGKGGKRISFTGKQTNRAGDWPYWSEEEDNAIRAGLSGPEIQKKFPHRTLGAIYRRRNALGISVRKLRNERDSNHHKSG